MDNFSASIRLVSDHLAALSGGGAAALRAASDDELCAATVAVEHAGRLLDALRVAAAGEIQHRSRHGLGTDALAHRYGHSKGSQLIEQLTRVAPAEASRRVHLGRAMRPSTALDGTPLPAEHEVVAVAMMAGQIGVDAAAVIVRCLDQARETATDDAILVAETALVDSARTVSADEVGVQARAWREALDQDGAEPRDERLNRKRSFHLGREVDGLTPFSGQLEPLGAALLKSAFAEADKPGNSPRFLSEADQRAGATFVTDDDGETEITIIDSRSREQRHYDVFTGLMTAGVRATGTEPGGMRSTASVTAVITLDNLRSGQGIGWLDEVDEPVSAATIQQLVCMAGFAPLLLGDNGEVLNLGRERRLFTPAQIKAMTARDGGCVNCGAPASWCDAHHVLEWSADGGPTDIDNGVLLCKGCHRMFHHTEFALRMIDGRPHILAPPWLDPEQRWRPLRNHRMRATLELDARPRVGT
jgi:hypothetical protein